MRTRILPSSRRIQVYDAIHLAWRSILCDTWSRECYLREWFIILQAGIRIGQYQPKMSKTSSLIELYIRVHKSSGVLPTMISYLEKIDPDSGTVGLRIFHLITPVHSFEIQQRFILALWVFSHYRTTAGVQHCGSHGEARGLIIETM